MEQAEQAIVRAKDGVTCPLLVPFGCGCFKTRKTNVFLKAIVVKAMLCRYLVWTLYGLFVSAVTQVVDLVLTFRLQFSKTAA